MNCSICFCEINKKNRYIKCEINSCYFDIECIANYFDSANNKSNKDNWIKYKKIKCPTCTNNLNEDLILDNKTIRKKYINLTHNIEGTIASENTRHEIEITMSKNNSTNISKSILFEIKNNILTNVLSCPNCNQPFIDFSGCLALECAGCDQHFCGLCLKLCKTTQDSHRCVASHTQNYSNDFKLKYEFNEVFFISTIGWQKWIEKIKKEAILKYLLEFKIEIIWTNINDILNTLHSEKLITLSSCIEIENIIYYHDLNNQIHNLRIPIEFTKICSGKFNIKFEEVITKYLLPTQHKIEIGNIIIKEINKIYPNWKFKKFRVPGETYSANNYPPQLLPLISKIIENYCDDNNIWKLLNIVEDNKNIFVKTKSKVW